LAVLLKFVTARANPYSTRTELTPIVPIQPNQPGRVELTELG